MFYLVATILLNVLLSIIFKTFPKYNIDALQAIVTNYFVCIITGSLYIGHMPYAAEHTATTWFPWAWLMGASFISIFNLIAYCTKVDGITTATIANKLSLVIPVAFSIIFMHEAAGMAKIAGVFMALPAVFLTTRVKEANGKEQKLFWPALLFIGSGLLDTLVNYVQHNHLQDPESQAVYTIYCFSVAAILGTILLTVMFITKKATFHIKNVIAGICVGIPNYFCIYFLIRSLNCGVLQSSATIPVINIGIVVASSIVAILFYKEKTNTSRLLGLAMSIIAILLIALGD